MNDSLTNPLRIAFVGPPGSGKTTTAWLLQRKLVNAVVVSIAAPLKEVEHFVYRVMGESPPGLSGSQDGLMLQQIREIFETRRSKFLERHFVTLVNSCDNSLSIINDDCRCALLSTLKSLGFMFVWVEGNHLSRRLDKSLARETGNPHDDVIPRKDCDLYVENRGTIGDLERNLDDLDLWT